MSRKLILTVIMFAAVAFAQDETGPGGGGGGGGRGGMGGGMEGMGGGGPRMQRQSKLEILASKLKINREQEEEVNNVLTAGVREAAPVRQKIDSERANITNAILAGKAPNMETYNGLIGELLAIEAKTFGQILAALKPNQTNKAGQHFELLADTFEAPQVMGRGMGRGGMQRGGGRN